MIAAPILNHREYVTWLPVVTGDFLQVRVWNSDNFYNMPPQAWPCRPPGKLALVFDLVEITAHSILDHIYPHRFSCSYYGVICENKMTLQVLATVLDGRSWDKWLDPECAGRI